MSNVSSKAPTKSQPFLEPWKAFVVAVVIFFGAQMAGSALFSFYPLLKRWPQARTDHWVNGAFVQFFYILLVEALVFGAIWWLLKRFKYKLKTIGWDGLNLWYIVYALAGFGAYFIASDIIQSIATAIAPSLNAQPQQNVGFSSAAGFWQLAATFVSLVVLPPIVEETLFRGFLFTSFRKKMTLLVTTLLVSSLFALPHLFESDGNGLLWLAGLDTFTLSVVLCYLREKTGSLWPGVFIHGTKNSLAFVSLFVLHVH